MELQDHLESLQKLIFQNLHGNNECRISALVPLVEESYGIYKFATRMLIAMHQCKRQSDPPRLPPPLFPTLIPDFCGCPAVENARDALQPLRERFNTQHHMLRRFYLECAGLQYLRSLIPIPSLPAVTSRHAQVVVCNLTEAWAH